jgi:hypothetical protein
MVGMFLQRLTSQFFEFCDGQLCSFGRMVFVLVVLPSGLTVGHCRLVYVVINFDFQIGDEDDEFASLIQASLAFENKISDSDGIFHGFDARHHQLNVGFFVDYFCEEQPVAHFCQFFGAWSDVVKRSQD